MQNSIIGDFNNDSIVNVLYVILLVNYILSPELLDLNGSDINSDGEANILDIINLINIILNTL